MSIAGLGGFCKKSGKVFDYKEKQGVEKSVENVDNCL